MPAEAGSAVWEVERVMTEEKVVKGWVMGVNNLLFDYNTARSVGK
jgi:hypothetical protein